MLEHRIAAVRHFNRFYTRRIGVLKEGLLDSPLTLTESRLLWELAHHETQTAADLARSLELDPGYLSRILKRFKQRGWIDAERAEQDGRQLELRLNASGREAFAPLETGAQRQVGDLLGEMPEPEQQSLLEALNTVERLLIKSEPTPRDPFVLRPSRPGDLGWSVARHGALYAQEYGWSVEFEGAVARIASDFVARLDAAKEAFWIAERDGANVGSVMLVQARDDSTQQVIPGVAQLRMLLVEPWARGYGIGHALVAECERFARTAGYERIVLWTHSNLTSARRIYSAAGYTCVAGATHVKFGLPLASETWEKTLT